MTKILSPRLVIIVLAAALLAYPLVLSGAFSTDIGEIALIPGAGGVFAICIDDDAVWSRAELGRFPEIKELKQIVRDRIAPGKLLEDDREAQC